MMSNSYVAFLVTLVCALQGANRVDAGCCDRCGTTCTTKLVCRTICTTKIVEDTYWDDRCDIVCMPPKSACMAGCTAGLSCEACETCDSCDVLGGCADCSVTSPLLSGWFSLLGHFSKCHFRDRNKLIRKSYVQYVPKLECVVEQLCSTCCDEVLPPLFIDEPDVLPTQPEPPASASPPVRLQISDQLEEQNSPSPAYIDAGMDPDEIPAAGQTLAPIAPVIHILSR